VRKPDLYTKAILTVIDVCLVALVARVYGPALEPVAHADEMGKINYSKDDGVGVACSADGKHVYVAGTEGFMRSDDYGRVGSWEKTIKED